MACQFRRFVVALGVGCLALVAARCGDADPSIAETASSDATAPTDVAQAPEAPVPSFEEPADDAAEMSETTTETIVFGDDFPEVLAVDTTLGSGQSWNFSVTLSSTYDTPQRYADAWRVLDANDVELGIRVLGHDHANEQPFTRSTTGEVPEGTAAVWVEGRDQANGWSGQRFEVALSN